MSNADIQTAAANQAAKAEGELRKAAVEALKRNDLPEDLIERTKTLPGTPFNHREAFAKLPDADGANLRKAFRDFAGFSVGNFDKLTGAGSGENGRQTQASQLIDIAKTGCTLFRDGDDAFADVENDGNRETWPVRSRRFGQWLQLRYFEDHGGAPNNEALQTARGTIEATARFQGPAHRVYRRVASFEGCLYLDLCDSAWRAVEIAGNGWRIVERAPVRFVRSRTAREIPIPEPGGRIEDLRSFLNLADDNGFVLAVAWVLAALRMQGPFPVLAITGEQGSAKSTCARILRTLVDPHDAPLRSAPRNEQDLFIAARNAHVLAFDNLSAVHPWLSDALCRISTGGGFAARELYSNDEECVISVERPQILNGIDEVVSRGDLADRAIFLALTAIADADRKPEAALWADFEAARPRILGALLDALVVGLRRLPEVSLDRLPRMADFAKWATACEHGAGAFADGAFMAAYTGNRAEAVESVIDASPVASAIRDLMRSRATWEGTATELLDELGGLAGDSVTKAKVWPKNPRALGARLNRINSALRPAGIVLDKETSGKRRIRISAQPKKGCNFAPVAPFAPKSHENKGESEGANRAQTRAEGVNQGAKGASCANGANSQDFSVEREKVSLPKQSPGTERAGDAYRRLSRGE